MATAEWQQIAAAVRGTRLETAVATLASRAELPVFTPRAPWQRSLSTTLLSAPPERLLPALPRDAAEAVVSGLLLWNDDLDASHTLSQDLHSRTGSYLHGIMHRREPDYGNAGYWFRLVGSHPIFPRVRSLAEEAGGSAVPGLLKGTNWDPFAMIDCCKRAERTVESPAGVLLRTVQLAELQALIAFAADGGTA